MTFLIKDKKSPEWVANRLGMRKEDVEKACIAIFGIPASKVIEEKSYEVDSAEWVPEVG